MFYDTRKNDHGLPRDPVQGDRGAAPGRLDHLDEREGRDQPRALFVLQRGVGRAADRDVLQRRPQGFAGLRRRRRRSSSATLRPSTCAMPWSRPGSRSRAASMKWSRPASQPAPSRLVRPPRVAASPCALECKLLQIVDLRRSRRPADPPPRRVRPGGRRPYRRPLHQGRPARHRRDAADRTLRLRRLRGRGQGDFGRAAARCAGDQGAGGRMIGRAIAYAVWM